MGRGEAEDGFACAVDDDDEGCDDGIEDVSMDDEEDHERVTLNDEIFSCWRSAGLRNCDF
jgi:hypothetical protein